MGTKPVKRCLDRLTDSKWANSDILLVSGESQEEPWSECGSQARQLGGNAG